MSYYNFNSIVKPMYELDKHDFLLLCYNTLKMSDIEILEVIANDTGVTFSRASIGKWRRDVEIKSRNPHERFQNAVDKKRFNHKEVANKIDYTHRKINYNKRFINYEEIIKGQGYKWVCDLDRYLNKCKKTISGLAKYLSVELSTVYSWIKQKNRVSKQYQNKIAKYLKARPEKIFSDKKVRIND